MNKLIKAAAALSAAGLLSAAGHAADIQLGHTIIHPGDLPSNVGAHTTFTGQVRHDSINRPDINSPYSVSIVTFEPGARTFWHTHPAGQRLLILSGEGLIGTPDGKVERVHPGDIVWCPPGLKHWHGATPKTAMSHMAFSNMKDGKNVTWMEEVSEADYHYPEEARK